MKIVPSSLKRTVVLGLVAVVAMIVIVPTFRVVGATASINSSSPAASARDFPLDTTTTTSVGTTTTTLASGTTTTTDPAATEAIFDGPSRGECITPADDPGDPVQSSVSSFDEVTGTTVTCVSAYADNVQTWSQWELPWVIKPQYGYVSWVAQEPQTRQLVLAVNLIPLSLQNVSNPTKWERACAAGDYDAYATKLGRNLVAAGFQNTVIRLGDEMNGVWEPDFIGMKVSQQKLWAKCFANEVTGLRRAKGEDFLIDWNPNACAGPFPYPNYYPGNAYVNILGLDMYDIGCLQPYTRLTFTELADEPYGLKYFEAFAASKKKPMSFPEWSLNEVPSGDDPGYISGVGEAFKTGDFAFESYFDIGGTNLRTLPLGPATPLSLAAFQTWFAST